MNKCELCKLPARIFCDSDQASLCWDCDAKVHTANFLVARHVRQLLCRTCLSPTPWKASGATLTNAASVCHRCVSGELPDEIEDGNDEELDTEDEDSDDVADFTGDEDGDNQVVPWSSTPPPPASPSGSECLSSSFSECRNNKYVDVSLSVSVSEPETTTRTETTTFLLKRKRDEDEPASDRDPQQGGEKDWESRRRWRVTEKRR